MSEEFLSDLDDAHAQEGATHANARLYSDPKDHYSHMVRMVIAEKNIEAQIVNSAPDKQIREVIDVNPYATLPTLITREVGLFHPQVIMQFLEERYPHPSLLPVTPVARARMRLTMYRLENDLLSKFDSVWYEQDAAERERKREILKDNITSWAALFSEKEFFMSDEFSFLDCMLCPLLWRLLPLGIRLPDRSGKHVHQYMLRLFKRRSFRRSCSQEEFDMRLGLEDRKKIIEARG